MPSEDKSACRAESRRYSHARFPLTPALSFGEREHPRRHWVDSLPQGCRRGKMGPEASHLRKAAIPVMHGNNPAAFATSRTAMLPLPKGEGRGEGKACIQSPVEPITRRPCLHWGKTVVSRVGTPAGCGHCSLPFPGVSADSDPWLLSANPSGWWGGFNRWRKRILDLYRASRRLSSGNSRGRTIAGWERWYVPTELWETLPASSGDGAWPRFWRSGIGSISKNSRIGPVPCLR